MKPREQVRVRDVEIGAVTRQIVRVFREGTALPVIGEAAWDWIDTLPTRHTPTNVSYWLQQAKRCAYALELGGEGRPRADISGLLYNLSEARRELKKHTIR